MRDLEEKEKELNKLKVKADGLLNNNHPASDKIEVSSFVFSSSCSFSNSHTIQWLCTDLCVCPQAYMDTLQTQWSWLLQITKCIHVHLKENAAYSQVSARSCSGPRAVCVLHASIHRCVLLPFSVLQGGQ